MPLKVLVLGGGRMAHIRARSLARCSDVSGLLVAARNRAQAEDVAASSGAMPVAFEAALRRGVDAAVVATGSAGHAALVDEAIALGVPVLCEKPLTTDPARSAEIAAAAAAHGVPVQVGYHRRFDSGVVALREAVRSGRAGILYSLRLVSHDHEPSPPGFIAGSGGLFRDLHVHDFDLLRYITGLEPERVYAVAAVRAHPQYEAAGDVDTAIVLVELSGGVVASVHGARHDPAGYDVRAELLGSGASIAAGLGERTPLELSGPEARPLAGPPWRHFADRFAAAFDAETEAFVELVQGRRYNPCPPSEDLAALAVAEACEASRRLRRPVEVGG